MFSLIYSDDCMARLHKLLRDEDFERAVLLMRAGRACWPESQSFGAQNVQPEDELMLMKEIYLADLATGEFAFCVKEFLINFPFGWRSKWSASLRLLLKGFPNWLKKCFAPSFFALLIKAAKYSDPIMMHRRGNSAPRVQKRIVSRLFPFKEPVRALERRAHYVRDVKYNKCLRKIHQERIFRFDEKLRLWLSHRFAIL